MNIGLVQLGNVSADTGGRNYMVNLTKALFKHNREQGLPHRFTWVLSPNQRHLIEDFLGESFSVLEVPPKGDSSVMKVVGEQAVLPFYLSGKQLDVVYFPGNFISVLSSVPSVVAIRSMLYYHYPQTIDTPRLLTRKFLTPISARRSRAIITPSQDIKNDVVRFVGIDERKIHVVSHGIDVDLFQNNYLEAERLAVFEKFGITKKFILYASALWRYKNHDKLIAAFATLIDEHRLDFQLVLAGKGIGATDAFVAELQALVKAKSLDGRVLFTGQVLHRDLKYLYKHAEVFAFPSGYESFGNPLFEAWAAGTPIVCANVHSFPEMTLNGKAALMVDATRVTELADGLYRACTDADLRRRFIAAGTERIQEFSWEKCVRETLAVLEKTASQ